MFRIRRFITIAIQLNLILFTFVLLGGCSATTLSQKVALLPPHIENMEALELTDQQQQLLNEAFKNAIEGRASVDERIYQALTGLGETNQFLVDDEISRRLLTSDKPVCYSFECQKVVAESAQIPFVAYGHISKHDDEYLVSVTLTNTHQGTYQTKQRRCTNCDFLEWVHEAKLMQNSVRWRPEGRVVSGLRVVELYAEEPRRSSESEMKRRGEEERQRLAEMLSRNKDSPRSDEEIQLIVEKNKARLSSIYQRALRDAPESRGQIVFKIIIEASGIVSYAEVISSELDNAALEKELAAGLKFMRFGVKNAQRSVTVSIDFFPS